MQMCYYYDNSVNINFLEGKDRYDVIIDRIVNREKLYILLYKLYAISKILKLRLIIENPATQPHYLLFTQNFIKPSIIDNNRMLRGDFYKKPTAYWFVNCEPTYGYSYQNDKEQKIINKCKPGIKAGLCSEERSLISPDYARNWICDFVIGKEQNISQLAFEF